MSDVVERAKSMLENVSRGPWEFGNHAYPDVVHSPNGCLWHPGRGEINNANDGLFIAAARTLVPELIAEVERLRRGGKTLGEIVESLSRMALDASGRHDLIDEDGDGDWGSVWETLAELGTEVERLRGVVRELEAQR